MFSIQLPTPLMRLRRPTDVPSSSIPLLPILRVLRFDSVIILFLTDNTHSGTMGTGARANGSASGRNLAAPRVVGAATAAPAAVPAAGISSGIRQKRRKKICKRRKAHLLPCCNFFFAKIIGTHRSIWRPNVSCSSWIDHSKFLHSSSPCSASAPRGDGTRHWRERGLGAPHDDPHVHGGKMEGAIALACGNEGVTEIVSFS